MDWIERIFGFVPDDGDGSLEFLIVVVATLLAAAAVGCHPRMRRAWRSLFGRFRQS
jgi:hypothetical protein